MLRSRPPSRAGSVQQSLPSLPSSYVLAYRFLFPPLPVRYLGVGGTSTITPPVWANSDPICWQRSAAFTGFSYLSSILYHLLLFPTTVYSLSDSPCDRVHTPTLVLTQPDHSMGGCCSCLPLHSTALAVLPDSVLVALPQLAGRQSSAFTLAASAAAVCAAALVVHVSSSPKAFLSLSPSLPLHVCVSVYLGMFVASLAGRGGLLSDRSLPKSQAR